MSIRLQDSRVIYNRSEESDALLAEDDQRGFPPPRSTDVDLHLGSHIDVEQSLKSPTPTPIPLLQIGLVAFYRASQPLSYYVIFTFVNPLLVDLGVSGKETVGAFSGFLESCAAVSMVAMLFVFARMGDRHGRKPVVLFGVIGTCLAGGSFGFGSSYPMLVAIRAATGFFNAGQTLVRALMMDISDASNRSQVFALGGMGFQVGTTLAPVMGAFFSRPAEQWPAIFEGTIFDRYPFALPCVMACGAPFLAALLGIFKLKETKLAGRSSAARKSLPPLLNRQSLFILTCVFVLCVHFSSLVAIETLLMFEPRELGGLGFSQGHMAFWFLFRPILITSLETTLYAKLVKRFGQATVLRTAVWVSRFQLASRFCPDPIQNAYAGTWICYLFASILAGYGAHRLVVDLTIFLGVCHTVVANLSFLTVDVVSFTRAPCKEQVADIGAMTEVFAQSGVALGSAAGSSLHALCLRYRLLPGGRLVYIILLGFSVFVAWFLGRYTEYASWADLGADEDAAT